MQLFDHWSTPVLQRNAPSWLYFCKNKLMTDDKHKHMTDKKYTNKRNSWGLAFYRAR